MEPIAKPRPRILAVDDVQDNLDLIREVFENEPYELVTARSAKEALELVHVQTPHVAILDVQMPDTDGFALCRKLREMMHTRKIPVVFLTAQCTSTADAVRGFVTGGCDYVTKPFEAQELRARIYAILRAQRDHDRDIAVTKTFTRRLLGR